MRSVSGEAESTDHEGNELQEGTTLDPTKLKLTTLTSANEGTLQNGNHTSANLAEEIPSSPLYTSNLELQNNDGDSDDVLLDL